MPEVIARPLISGNVFRKFYRPRLSMHPLIFTVVGAMLLSLSLNWPFLQQLQSRIPGQIALQRMPCVTKSAATACGAR